MTRTRMTVVAGLVVFCALVPVAAQAAPCPAPTADERGDIYLKDTSIGPGSNDTVNVPATFTTDGRMTFTGLRTPVATHRYELSVLVPGDPKGRTVISRAGGSALPVSDGETILAPSAGGAVALVASWQLDTRLPDSSFVPCERTASFLLPVANAIAPKLRVARANVTFRPVSVIDLEARTDVGTDLRPVTLRGQTSARLSPSGPLRKLATLKFGLHGDQGLAVSRRRAVLPRGLFTFGKNDFGGNPNLEIVYDGTRSIPRRGNFFVYPPGRTVYSRAGLKLQAVQGGKVIGTVRTGLECGARVRGSGLGCRFVGYRVS